jgi:hypothetical protein
LLDLAVNVVGLSSPYSGATVSETELHSPDGHKLDSRHVVL